MIHSELLKRITVRSDIFDRKCYPSIKNRPLRKGPVKG